MKGRFLVALFLYLAFAVVFSGCRTVDTVEGQTAHHVALQALTSGNCKIVLKVCQNAPLLSFTHKAPTFTSWGFVIT